MSNGKKWSGDEVAALREMCMAGYSNRHIAEQLGRTVQAIHHKRSKLRLTIDACLSAAAAGAKADTAVKEYQEPCMERIAAVDKHCTAKQKTLCNGSAAAEKTKLKSLWRRLFGRCV